jgi:hydroxyacylglutathione hydrolase
LASLDRMVAFADSRSVTHVLGCHIEMTADPGRDYPLGATYQPRERALPMTVDQLKDVQAAAASVADRQGCHRFDDFVIYNQPGPRDQLNLMAHGLLHKVGARILRRERN